MPTYNLRNKETGEEFTEFFSISGLEEYLSQNPQIEQAPSGAFAVLDPWRMGLVKPDNTFRDILKNVKKSHYGSRINTF